MAEASYARANELHIDEEFKQAAPLYDEAIRTAPTVAKYYLHRAANRLKLRDYIEVIPDVEKALSLSPQLPMAWLRKGQAYFALSEYESALNAFEQAQQMGSDKVDLWIRKCHAEIRRESAARPVVFTEAKSTAAIGTETKKPEVPAPQKPEAVAMETESAEKPPETLASKVKMNWTQNVNAIQITLFAKHLTSDKVTTSINQGELRVSLSLPDESVFEQSWHLYAPVVEEQLKVKVNAFKVELAVDKATPGDWRGLEADAKPEGLVLRENTASSSRVPPPYASKKDWSEVEEAVKQEEQAEKPEGNDALQKLFQQIYADGDPEVRRAMMKSYQTSGGTVLSTNWKDVQQRDYEKEGITPPKGQEVRKWGE